LGILVPSRQLFSFETAEWLVVPKAAHQPIRRKTFLLGIAKMTRQKGARLAPFTTVMQL